jgi:hypothetical protein
MPGKNAWGNKIENAGIYLPCVKESRSLPANLIRDLRQEPPLIIRN